MTAELKRSSQGQTLVLTLSSPAHRNALGPEIYTEGIEALGLAESSDDIHSVILVGEETLFSAGGNLQRLQANRQQPASVQAQSIDALHDWIEAIRIFPKPVIAAVEGAAAGAGFPLALAARLNERAPNALASIKTLINDSAQSTLVEQLARERDHFVRNLHHANAGIGISAFLTKTTPGFE